MENNDEKVLPEKLKQVLEDLKKSITKPNVLIAGASGVGKSSLINMVFGVDLAVVGTGKPVTQEMKLYESDDCDVRIFDSKGYEFVDAENDEFYEKVVSKANESLNPGDTIHLIWYCVAESGGRVINYDIQAINAFLSFHIPVAVIFTKADLGAEEDFIAMRAELPEGVRDCVFETSTKMPECNHLHELMDWSVSKLPEALTYALIKQQSVNLQLKRKEARKQILQHCTAAFAIGFSPIPMSDAPLLVANELALIARIMYLYDLRKFEALMKSAGLPLMLGQLLSSLGKSAVANILKFFPGGGTILGGLISGSVGATFTAAVGESTSYLSYKICSAMLSGDYSDAEEMIEKFGPLVIEMAGEWIKSGKKVDDLKNDDDIQ